MTRYLRWLAAATVALVTLAAALTIGMDPYDWWGTPRIEGVNARRGGGNLHTAWVKPRQYARGGPWGAVVAGNSRVQLGFDPQSASWPRATRPIYNFGLPGQSFRSVTARLEETLPANPPRLLMVGVDFTDFRVSEAAWRAHRPSDPSPRTSWQQLERALEATLSLTALADALKAIPMQRARYPDDQLPDGFYPVRPYAALVRVEGQAAMFDQRNRENFRNYQRLSKAVRWPGPGGSAAWDSLSRLKRLADAHGMELVLFTHPYHADLAVGLDRAGLSPALADFRVALAAWAAANGVEAWDFTRLNSVTMVGVPGPKDRRTLLPDYWEAGHYRAAVGNRMVRAMLRGEVEAGFGERLTVEEAQRVNAAWQAGLAAYLARDPATAARLNAVYGPPAPEDAVAAVRPSRTAAAGLSAAADPPRQP